MTAAEMGVITDRRENGRTHRVVVIPENVGGWFWTLQDDAREIDGAPSIDEQLRRTQNLGFWL